MVLGITNMTENWKTAFYFSPFFRDDASRLKLAAKLGEPGGTESGDVHIELFWQGMRDHLEQTKKAEGGSNEQHYPNFAKLYGKLFRDLREKIGEFRYEGRKLNVTKPWNYDVSDDKRVTKLGNNLVGTEIDVVLETPDHLFIGEAKHATSLRGESSYVLVHQLIRQYVMAKILVQLRHEIDGLPSKKVVPFIVRDARDANDHRREQVQVEFMLNEGWLKQKNVLSWCAVKKHWP